MSVPDSPHSAPAELGHANPALNPASSDKLLALPSMPRISSRSRPIRSFRGSFESLNQPDASPSRRIKELSGQSLSDGDTPKRVSFEGERPEISSLRREIPFSHETASPPQPNSRASSPSPLRSFIARAVTPRRPDEPFIPSNPFSFRAKVRKFSQDALHAHSPSLTPKCKLFMKQMSWSSFFTFFMDTLPRVVYLYILLGLPLLYFSRVARVFVDADVSRPDIQRMINTCGAHGSGFRNMAPRLVAGNADTRRTKMRSSSILPFPDEWNHNSVSPALLRFKNSWESFIDSVLREWKTLNVVSALLVSAILTMFQIPAVSSDPVTRTLSLLALLSSLIALSFGCMFIVRFAAMRSMIRAARWANDAREGTPGIFWNVWVMLSMPAVWLAWSMIFFIEAILAFVWRTGSVNDPEQRTGLSEPGANALRVLITALLVLGLVYLALIITTLRSYGRSLPGWVDLWDDGAHAHNQEDQVLRPSVAPSPRSRGRTRSRNNSVLYTAKARSDPALNVEGQRKGMFWGIIGLPRAEPDLEKAEGVSKVEE